MKQQFPTGRGEKRQALLHVVASVQDTLAAHAEESETLRTLPEASVAALTDAGLFAVMRYRSLLSSR
jgi:Na+-transporting NADH:ubiquinone oxidoreductase subunit NqrA